MAVKKSWVFGFLFYFYSLSFSVRGEGEKDWNSREGKGYGIWGDDNLGEKSNYKRKEGKNERKKIVHPLPQAIVSLSSPRRHGR